MTERRPDNALRRDVKRFQAPVPAASWSQLATSFGGFLAVSAAMHALMDVSYWLVLLLAPLAAGFLVRVFIIQHDCGHLAFFLSRRANDVVGMACSLLTLTPYHSWRRQHAGHHGVWNNLDRRQSGGDIYSHCLTLAEYRALSRRGRWWYRATRHPIVANLVLPPLVFTVLYRLPFDMPKSWRRTRWSVYLTNLALVGFYGGLGWALGVERLVLVQLPVLVLGSIIGVWLFSVQHRAEGAQWARDDAWDATTAALSGSIYLRLPGVLQWFTGNIGLHHVHHLSPRIPNYRLQECHDRTPGLHAVPAVSFRGGLRAMWFVLWDEEGGRMVTFSAAGSTAP